LGLALILELQIGKQEHRFMIRKKIKLGKFLAFIIWGIFITIMVNQVLKKAEEWAGTIEDDIRYYSLREFEGKVTRKFINREDHMRKTLILKQRKKGISTIQNEVFPFIIPDFYEYVVVGDSLVKKEGDLFATVYRGGEKDTVIYFKFKNYETGEVFPKE